MLGRCEGANRGEDMIKDAWKKCNGKCEREGAYLLVLSLVPDKSRVESLSLSVHKVLLISSGAAADVDGGE